MQEGKQNYGIYFFLAKSPINKATKPRPIVIYALSLSCADASAIPMSIDASGVPNKYPPYPKRATPTIIKMVLIRLFMVQFMVKKSTDI
jgi:hypothetical protein